MPRIPRALLIRNGFSVHKVWRGHNKEWNLGTEAQKTKYLNYLNEDIESSRFKNASTLHALTLMSNHSHEVAKIHDLPLFSNHMRRHHSKYGMRFNKENNRCGKVAQDRPHTCLIENDYHEMKTVFYVHANPMRAGIVGDSRDYVWSTHRLYAFGKKEKWMKNIVLPTWYIKLGKTMQERQKKYRSLFARFLKDTNNQKQNFLKNPFFGSPYWTENLLSEIKEWRKESSPPS